MSSLKIFIFNYLQVGFDVTLNCKSQPRKTNVKFPYVNAKIEKVWLLSPDIFEHKTKGLKLKKKSLKLIFSLTCRSLISPLITLQPRFEYFNQFVQKNIVTLVLK